MRFNISERKKTAVQEKKLELEGLESKLFSGEEKWISSQITRETYDSWFSNYNTEIFALKSTIERLSKDKSKGFKILTKHLNLMTDVKCIYNQADTLQKREFINLVFDSNLYYENGIYRTPTMMDIFTTNTLIIKKKRLLILDKKKG